MLDLLSLLVDACEPGASLAQVCSIDSELSDLSSFSFLQSCCIGHIKLELKPGCRQALCAWLQLHRILPFRACQLSCMRCTPQRIPLQNLMASNLQRVQALSAWLQRHHTTLFQSLPEPPLQQRLRTVASARPEDEADFWHSLGQAAALGWTHEAADLLGQHSAWRQLHRTHADQGTIALVRPL